MEQEIIKLAREAGLDVDGAYFADDVYRAVLTRFASLIAMDEREACAQLCEEFTHPLVTLTVDGRARLAIAIRARSEL